MNGPTHQLTGLSTGIAVTTYANTQLRPTGHPATRALGCVAGSLAGAALPDIIEPALTPNHRGLFHSVLVLGLVCWGLRELTRYLDGPRPDPGDGASQALVEGLAIGAGCGYVSHLAADSLTPMGLPLV